MSQSSSTYTATIYNVRITTSSGSSSGSTGGTTTTANTLKGAMSGTFGKVGNAVNLSDLRNSNTLAIIKKDFNSITMENETKPDAVLGYSPTLISTSEAKSRGYIIPDGYAESTVPVLDYSNIDEVLKIASQNGLSVRFHTMVWHQQTPSWFFKYDYNSYYSYCNAGTMDKRLEYYVKNIVAHVSTSQYKNVVYAYDVVNEYFHNSDTGSKSNWTQVYGEEGTRTEKSAMVLVCRATWMYIGRMQIISEIRLINSKMPDLRFRSQSSTQPSMRCRADTLLFSQLGVKKAAYDAVINAMK